MRAHPRSLLLTLLLAAAAPIRAEDALTLDVDASEAPRRLLHATLRVPATPGPLTLQFPKWLPGEHGPTGLRYAERRFHVRAEKERFDGEYVRRVCAYGRSCLGEYTGKPCLALALRRYHTVAPNQVGRGGVALDNSQTKAVVARINRQYFHSRGHW